MSFDLAQNNIRIEQSCSVSEGMPQFQNSLSQIWQQKQNIVLRVYQVWGDGSDDGWKAPIQLPEVTWNGEKIKSIQFIPVFSYDKNYIYGSVGFGYDQYAQYYSTSIPENMSYGKILFSGAFPQASYISYKVEQPSISNAEFFDNEFSMIKGCNPFIVNNPSVIAYNQTNKVSAQQKITKQDDPSFLKTKADMKRPTPHVSVNESTGQVGFYRLDRLESSSNNVQADDVAPDGCSRSYLFAYKENNQDILILRVKVPHTFMDSDTPDQIYQNYEASYFSVGSHRYYEDTPVLDFWAVNARMLNHYKDKDGYAYVFFAPNSYVEQVVKEQHTAANHPPVMTWGNYKGYLLGLPTYALILRYKQPQKSWIGSPENAICYDNPSTLMPISKGELGDYTPELFGGSLDDFQSGHIGIVDQNLPWPN